MNDPIKTTRTLVLEAMQAGFESGYDAGRANQGDVDPWPGGRVRMTFTTNPVDPDRIDPLAATKERPCGSVLAALRSDLRRVLGLTEAANDYDIVAAAQYAATSVEDCPGPHFDAGPLEPPEEGPLAPSNPVANAAPALWPALDKLREILWQDDRPRPWDAVIAEVDRLKHQVEEDVRVRQDLNHELGDMRDGMAAMRRDLEVKDRQISVLNGAADAGKFNRAELLALAYAVKASLSTTSGGLRIQLDQLDQALSRQIAEATT